MNNHESCPNGTLEHRGCAIHTASYEVEPTRWLPEACMWVQTEAGSRKLWVHSFAHCFAAEQLTFSNKLDADTWALEAAKSIIDRASEKLEANGQARQQSNYFSRIFRLTGRTFFGLRRAQPNR